MSQSSSPSRRCRQCGAPMARWMSASVCPACILNSSAVLGEELTDEGQPGSRPSIESVTRIDFGDYVLEEEIAHGGMGVVYRARQISLDRVVAIKLLLLGRYSSAESIERFRREAQSIAALHHPGIVAVHEVGEYQGQHFISMEYVDGPTLANRLRHGPFAPERAAEITRDVAKAVQYAHERGVLHRDLKPSNVLLDSFDIPRITDFGLAKKLDGSTDLTLTGQMVGTPNYLSPEQAGGRHAQVGPASDVYAIGALLYELVTGRPPFMADSLQETLLRIRDAEPVSPRALNPAVDREIETICLKCLEKEPSRRYGSAAALADDLERWLRDEPIQARAIGALGRLGKWTRRNPTTAALLFVATAGVAAFLVGQTVMSIRLQRANTEVGATNLRLHASLHEMQWRRADEAVEAGDFNEAIAWWSHFLRDNPSNSVAAARLLSLLASRNFPLLLHPPLPHEASVTAVDFGQTGERLVTLTAGNTARVWRVQSGQLEFEAAHPAQLSQGLLCGERDERLLTITVEPKARLWDLNRRQAIRELGLEPVDERILGRKVERTRDGRRLAINMSANVVAVIDAETGEWVASPLELPAGEHNFALSEDGRLLATGSRSQIQLCDAASSRPLFSAFEVPGLPLLRFSEDGHWLACSAGGRVTVINTLTGTREHEFAARAYSINFVGSTNEIVVEGGGLPELFDFQSGQNRGVPFGQLSVEWPRQEGLARLLLRQKGAERFELLDPATGQPRQSAFYHDGWVTTAQLSPNGRVVATASQDRSVRLWSVTMNKPEPVTIRAGDAVYESQWNPAADKILTTSQQGDARELRLWHGQTGEPLIPPRKLEESVELAAWAPDGTRFATGSPEGIARICDGESGAPISPPLRHGGAVQGCTFSPDGNILVTASDDQTVRLWDGHSGAAVGVPLASPSIPYRIAFSRDGRRLSSAHQDGTVRVWSVPEGKLSLGPLRHDGTCWVALFSPDGRRLVTGSADGTARLWDANTGELELPSIRHESSVFWATFSPDGSKIATCTDSGITRVWDSATGKMLAGPMRHPRRIWTVRWSPDGRFLATTCMDGNARIWEAASGHLAAEPFAHEKQVRRVAFSPDMRRFLTGSLDGTVKIWDLTLLRPPLPVPGWLPELAEALGGKRIGDQEAPATVPGETLERVRQKLPQTVATKDYYAAWARWMLEERFESPVKPFRQ